MLTQKEIDAFQEEVLSFLETDFTAIDVCRFVRDNSTAQYLLGKYVLCEYEKELEFINDNPDCELEYILGTPSIDFYDSYCGDSDPLDSFRISKKAFIDDKGYPIPLTIDNICELDNIFIHMLWQLDNEVIEIPQIPLWTN
jgi:hypothetical protein